MNRAAFGVALVAFMVMPLMVVTPSAVAADLPSPGDWSEAEISTSNMQIATDSGENKVGVAAYNLGNGNLELKIGSGAAYITTTIANAGGGGPCIARGADDNQWYAAFRDAVSQTLMFTSTTNGGSSWSTPVQALPNVQGQHYCQISILTTGTILIIHGGVSHTSHVVYRSINGGATFAQIGTIDATTQTPIYTTFTSHYGDDQLFMIRDQSSIQPYLYKWALDGQSWTSLGTPGPLAGWDLYGGLVQLNTGRILFMATYSSSTTRVYWSANGGSTWANTDVYVTSCSACLLTSQWGSNGLLTDGVTVWGEIKNRDLDTIIMFASDDGGLTYTTSAQATAPRYDSDFRWSRTDSTFHHFWNDPIGGVAYVRYADIPGASAGSGGSGGGTGTTQPLGGGSRVQMFNVDPAAERTATTLYGFDHDLPGFTLITREADGTGGETIRTYDGGSLNNLGIKQLPNGACGFHGVIAGEKNVGYKDCSTETQNVLQVRSRTLGTSLKPDGCSVESCLDTYADLDETGALPPIERIQDIEGFTVDYDGFTTGTVKGDATILGMAYTAYGETNEDGADVGVFAYNGIDADRDDEGENEILSKGFGPALEGTYGLCSWVDGASGIRYVAAAHPEVGVRSWRITIEDPTPNVHGVGIKDIEVTSAPKWTGGPSTTGAHGLACHGSTVYFTTDAGLKAINQNTGVQIWSKNQPFESEAVAVSGDGFILAAMNDTQIMVYDAKTGQLLATMNLPSTFNGAFNKLGLTYRGGTVWLAHFDGLASYNIEPATCVFSCGYVPNQDSDGDGITDDQDPTGTGVLPVDPNAPANAGALGTPMGLGSIPVALFIAQWFFPLGGAVAAWAATGGRIYLRDGFVQREPGSPTVMVIAFVVGMIMAVPAFGMPFGYPLLLGVVSIAVVAVRASRQGA